MNTLDLSGLSPQVSENIGPFCRDLLAAHGPNIHSLHVIGSAVTTDYQERRSDINSLVVLHEMDLRFVEFLAPLGKQYGKKGIAAPLVMTPHYIRSSLDAFPVEFLDFQRIHKTVYGDDLFRNLHIPKQHLRLQCEREIKTRLIGLRQGYLASLGKRDPLAAVLVRAVTGAMPLLRAIILLRGTEPPVARPEVTAAFGAATGIGTEVFAALLALKAKRIRPSEHELQTLFERFYTTLEAVGKLVDELHA